MKKFFSIEQNAYTFEWYDLTALITIFNVLFVMAGYHWAPMLGLLNCGICIILNVMNRAHINAYLTQAALIILNSYFLTL